MITDEYWLFTIQMARWRYAKTLDIPIFDITAKSGIHAFAPNWYDLMAYKRGEMNSEEYSNRYHHKVISNLERDIEYWNNFLQYPTVAIACYCKPGEFCHRYLFTNLLIHFLQYKNKKVIYQGELIPHPFNQELF